MILSNDGRDSPHLAKAWAQCCIISSYDFWDTGIDSEDTWNYIDVGEAARHLTKPILSAVAHALMLPAKLLDCHEMGQWMRPS
ncbi:hypothetical protein CU102_21990 [Phyllobacterium brassicacearum]|uniref:Uncharacterized protein n=1 Tax=Phyllobacterium brassicacearum TaxID=314235 RepID=A0A2P7BD11_9HYPH|nr:hypothetical protein CU102_21990 [Phyllobacterium brassicacearum]